MVELIHSEYYAAALPGLTTLFQFEHYELIADRAAAAL